MCKHGHTVSMKLTNHTNGEEYTSNIDSCLVKKLISIRTEYGITRSSCCGHGKWPGLVQFEDWSYAFIDNPEKRFSSGTKMFSLLESRSRWWSEFEEFKGEDEFLDHGLKISSLPILLFATFIKRDFSWIRNLLK